MRPGQANVANPVLNLLSMRFLVVCGGNSGWRYRTSQDKDILMREAPIIIADEQGKAQGLSIERDLRVQDVLGRMIVIREVACPTDDEENSVEEAAQRQNHSLGAIGWQNMENNQ
jgi:hypothetical protein